MASAVALGVTGVFLTVDLAFFGANALKIAHGGWLPLFIGALLFTLMTTWKTGRQIVAQRLTARAVPLEEFMARIAESRPARVPGTAVFMTAQPRGPPPALAHNLRYNKVLHEHVVTLTVTTQPVPHVSVDEQITVRPLGQGLFDVVALRFHGGSRRPGGACPSPGTGARTGRAGRHLFPGQRDAHCHSGTRNGHLAGAAVRVDGSKRCPRDGILQTPS